jgi:putative ABC transport system permease protein
VNVSESDSSQNVWLENLVYDFRYALRSLARNPGFALAVIATLALGIGANTAIFSVVNAAFLRPLPYRNADRVAWVSEFYPKFNRPMVPATEYEAWKRQNTSFEQLEGYRRTEGVNLASAQRAAQRVQAGHVTPGFFAMLGVSPRVGRWFSPEEGEPGHDRVAVLSERLWQDYFHSDPHIVGRQVVLDGNPYTVTGVMPGGFLYPDGLDTAVWLPSAINTIIPEPYRSIISVIGRLKPGVSFEKARANLEVIARGMDSQYPPPWAGYHAAATVRVVSLQQQLTASSKTALYVLMGAVGFILLIVCANVANLFVARALTREREFAIRAAIGASRRRMSRLLIFESLILGVLGGAIGVALTYAAVSGMGFLMPQALPSHISIDSHVLGFALLCSVFTSLLFGLAPAVSASKPNLNVSLKQGRRRMSRLFVRNTLAVAQVALSVILLIGAGLLIRSFIAVLNVNTGFDAHNVVLGDISLAPIEMYTPPRQVAFFNRVLAAAARLPGVETVGLSSATPLVPFNEIAGGLRAEGEPESDATVVITSSNGAYFKALRIPLLAGRFFTDGDRAGTPRVALINRSLAQILFADRDPIGRRIKLDDGWVTVAGVVGNIRHRALDSKIWPELFQPYQQAPSTWMSLVIRTSQPASDLGPQIQKAVQSIDPAQPVFDIASLEERISVSVAQRRERAYVLGGFAVLALLIAAVGAYSVIAYSVTRRTQELGVRLALGAERRDLLGMILGEGFRLSLMGIIIGVAGAFELTHVLSTFLFEVTATDPLTFVVVCGALIFSVCLASYLPARRASKVDPMVALRHE